MAEYLFSKSELLDYINKSDSDELVRRGKELYLVLCEEKLCKISGLGFRLS